MSVRIVPFAPEHEAELLALSLGAWAPVFEELEPAVLPFVHRAFYPKAGASGRRRTSGRF